MALLLDTHVIIWLDANPKMIPNITRERIYNDAALKISVASIWEMAIKTSIGKLTLPKALPEFISIFCKDYKVRIVPLQLSHIYHIQQLPLHHRDPFDRLLIAQSFVESIPIVSADEIFDQYISTRVWA